MYRDQADEDHHRTPIEERIKYLTENLDLDNNALIQEDDVKSKLIQILIKNWNCFDINNNRTSKCNSTIKHHIDTGDATPIKSKCRPLNPIWADKVKARLEDLEKRGIIRKSSSPWASPILIVMKNNGDIRLVADYRRINEKITANAWPISI